MSLKKFCIIGLGYFGINLALRLAEEGAEVLAIDINSDRVDMIKDRVSLAVCMDSTNERAMRSQGLKDMDAVVVAIGEDFESSINTTAILQEIGVKRILARVISPIHERLVKLMNIDELLVPEAEAAAHLSNRLTIPGLIESYEISSEYGIYEIKIPDKFIGKTLLETNLRYEFSLNLVTVKRFTKKRSLLIKEEKEIVEVIGVPTPNYVFKDGDIMVVFGKEQDFLNMLES